MLYLTIMQYLTSMRGNTTAQPGGGRPNLENLDHFPDLFATELLVQGVEVLRLGDRTGAVSGLPLVRAFMMNAAPARDLALPEGELDLGPWVARLERRLGVHLEHVLDLPAAVRGVMESRLRKGQRHVGVTWTKARPRSPARGSCAQAVQTTPHQ